MHQDACTIGTRETCDCLHRLAAQYHTSRKSWYDTCQSVIKPTKGKTDAETLGRYASGDIPDSLRAMVLDQGAVAAEMFTAVTGLKPEQTLGDRRLEQFCEWAAMMHEIALSSPDMLAITQSPSPFLWLDVPQQYHCYNEATCSFRVLLTLSGCALPAELPVVVPANGPRKLWLQSRHVAGLHGPYLVRKDDSHRQCQACGATRRA